MAEFDSRVDMSELSVEDDSKTKEVKLPYFHRTLSEQDSALIGDIRPKPIEATSVVLPAGGGEVLEKKLSESSSWNSAGTWESRNCTQFAKDMIPGLVAPFDFSDSAGNLVKISSCDKPDGNAEIVHTRGKVRYIYDLTLTLQIAASSGVEGKETKGTIAIESVMPGELDDLDLTLTFKSNPPNYTAVRKMVFDSSGPFRKEMKTRLEDFEKKFKEL